MSSSKHSLYLSVVKRGLLCHDHHIIHFNHLIFHCFSEIHIWSAPPVLLCLDLFLFYVFTSLNVNLLRGSFCSRKCKKCGYIYYITRTKCISHYKMWLHYKIKRESHYILGCYYIMQLNSPQLSTEHI